MQRTLMYCFLIAAFINVLEIHYSALCQVVSCEPAEIGSNHQVDFKVDNKCNKEIPRIESHDNVLAKCPDYNVSIEHTTKYKFTLSKEADGNKLTLHINNISMTNHHLHIWFRLKDGNNTVNKTCTPSLYSKAKELNCSTNVTKDGVLVWCVSSLLYPRGDCEFETNLAADTYETNVTTINETTNSNVTYFSQYCSLSVPVSNLSPGYKTVNVAVYPKIENTTDIAKSYGTKTSNFINLELPSVHLKNCPQIANEGENVTCHCEQYDSSNVSVVIYWYNNLTQANVSTGSVSFTANRNKTESFYCQSMNIFGWKSNPVLYHLQITFPQYINTFSVNDEVNKTVRMTRFKKMTLFCEAEEADNQSIIISKDDTRLASSNNNTITWTKSSASCGDSGVYQCNVSRYRHWAVANLTVTLCDTKQSGISNEAESKESISQLQLVTLIAIGAAGFIGMLIMIVVFYKVSIQIIMNKNKRSPFSKEVVIGNQDMYFQLLSQTRDQDVRQ